MIFAKRSWLRHRLAATLKTAVIAGAIHNNFHLSAATCAGKDLARRLRRLSGKVNFRHLFTAAANAAIPAVAGDDLFYHGFTLFALKISHISFLLFYSITLYYRFSKRFIPFTSFSPFEDRAHPAQCAQSHPQSQEGFPFLEQISSE